VNGLSLRQIARALGGEVSGGQVLSPGPGHSPKDRSMAVQTNPEGVNGFVVFSYCGDDFRLCRDHVTRLLGLDPGAWRKQREPSALRPRPTPAAHPLADNAKTTGALALWREGVDPRRTPVELYLNIERKLDLPADLCGDVLRWHAATSAMLALFRNILTDEPQAVSRTFLDAEGRKVGRKFLGPVAGAAVKLDPDESVLEGLHIGEGVETCLAARQLGLRPCWALGSAGAVAHLTVLAGVETLTLLRENDVASERACEVSAERWHAAGREVLIDYSLIGKDLNDALRGKAARV
jgi:putative DNA primase/helicase